MIPASLVYQRATSSEGVPRMPNEGAWSPYHVGHHQLGGTSTDANVDWGEWLRAVPPWGPAASIKPTWVSAVRMEVPHGVGGIEVTSTWRKLG
jgi:hypothetical protein